MDDGGDKYGPFNWQDTPIQASVYYDAMMRHLMAWYTGENVDPGSESGRAALGRRTSRRRHPDRRFRHRLDHRRPPGEDGQGRGRHRADRRSQAREDAEEGLSREAGRSGPAAKA